MLRVPAQGTRPTSARIREALFSKLEHWNMVENAIVLDLYAGSGALGLEALSRGAAACTFVDNRASALKIVKVNAQATSLTQHCQFYQKDADAFLESLATWSKKLVFDLIFMDPPYAFTTEEITSTLAQLPAYMNEHSVIVLERDGRSDSPCLPNSLQLFDDRKWGQTRCWFIELAPVSSVST